MHDPSPATTRPPIRRVVAVAVTALLVSSLSVTVVPATAASAAPGTVTLGTSDRATGAGLVGATKKVTYAGVTFRVPATWTVYDLARTPGTCVRFDRNAVYLGTPAADQNCPARAVGRTEALLVQPTATVPAATRPEVSSLGARPSLTATSAVDGLLATTLTGARLTLTATFGERSALARDVVASAVRTATFTAPAVRTATFTAPAVSATVRSSGGQGVSDGATYSAPATATFYRGKGFDTCAAPSTSAMSAWKMSSYRAIGIYIGGMNRACGWGNLSASWVRTVAKAGWRMQPIYVGRQPSCTYQGGMSDISSTLATAKSQGRAAAADAVKQAKLLGFVPGSVIYNDIEGYDPRKTTCSTSTMAFLDAWTRALHDVGFSSGVYSSATGAITDMARYYTSSTWAAPDVVWTARWDGVASTSEKLLTSSQWANRQRTKQYRGDHDETWGGVRINIDSNYMDTSLGSATYQYKVTAGGSVNTRSGPSVSFAKSGTVNPGTVLSVVCQLTYTKVDGDPIWDKLADGRYISDRYLATPSATGFSAPLPQCAFTYLVPGASLNMRSGPSTGSAITGKLAHGSSAAVVCQRSGTTVGGSRVWDRLMNGSYVSDAYLPTPGHPGYTAVIPRCL